MAYRGAHWKSVIAAFALVATWIVVSPLVAAQAAKREYQDRVQAVRAIPGLAAFWDFVLRDGETGRFVARTAGSEGGKYPLDAVNYVRTYWQEGRAATYEDFPLLGRGPFGQGVHFREEPDSVFRPTLLLPRERFHAEPLDVGGPNQSVSMAVWMAFESGNHAIAGIWHEGTDLQDRGGGARRVEAGRRQYALFAGLAANQGASAVHISENGRASFGDRYARNLATTRRLIPRPGKETAEANPDSHWSVVGFVFDNQRNAATAYLDGVAEDFWIEEDLDRHPFFRWPARGWKQGQMRKLPGLQDGEDPDFPEDQFYLPPEDKPLRRERVSASREERIWVEHFEFTRVRVTERRNVSGSWETASRELAALRVNPFWFGHDLYKPSVPAEGGPFTIGRVIHSGRSQGIVAVIGGVAVYNRALSPLEMRRLAEVGFSGKGKQRKASLLAIGDLEEQ